MTTRDDDAFWRRPPGKPAGTPTGAPADEPVGRYGPPPSPPYAGPPRSAPPPAGWRPPTVVRPEPPRSLPAQDHARLDRTEQAAKTLTKGIGLLAGAVILVLLLVLCGRLLF